MSEAPAHYTAGGIETIDYIRAKLTPEGFIGYLEGNILKYQSRWRHKGGLRDLHKAQEYLGWLIAAQPEPVTMESIFGKAEAPELTPELEARAYLDGEPEQLKAGEAFRRSVGADE